MKRQWLNCLKYKLWKSYHLIFFKIKCSIKSSSIPLDLQLVKLVLGINPIHLTSILGGTSGLFPFSSLVKKSSFFSSSHSLYVPIPKNLVTASSVSACLPDSCYTANFRPQVIVQAIMSKTLVIPDANQASLTPCQR